MENKKQSDKNTTKNIASKQNKRGDSKTNFNKSVKSVFFEITNQHQQNEKEGQQTKEKQIDIQNHKTLKTKLSNRSQKNIQQEESKINDQKRKEDNDDQLKKKQSQELIEENIKGYQIDNIEKRFLILQNQQLQNALINTRNIQNKSDIKIKEQTQQLQQIPILESQIEKLKKEKQNNNETLNKLQLEFQKLEEQEKNKIEIDKIIQDNKEQKLQILNQQKQIDTYNKENKILKQNFLDLQQMQQEIQEQNEQLIESNKNILEEKNKIQGKMYEKLQEIINPRKQKHIETSTLIENDITMKIRKYENNLLALQSQLKDQEMLQNCMQQLQQKNFDLEQENQNLILQLQDYLQLKQANEKLCLKISLLEQERQNIQNACEDYSKKIQLLQQEIQKIENQNRSKQINNSQIQEIMQLIQKEYQQNQQINDETIQLQQINNDIKKLQIENKRLQQQNQLNEIKVKSQENFIKSLEQQIIQQNEMQDSKNIKNMKNQIQQLYTKIEHLKDQNNNLQIEVDEQNRKVEQCRFIETQNQQYKYDLEEILKRLTKAEHQALNSQQHKNRSKFFEQEYLRLKNFYETNKPKIEQTEQRRIKNVTIRKEIQQYLSIRLLFRILLFNLSILQVTYFLLYNMYYIITTWPLLCIQIQHLFYQVPQIFN